MDNKAIGIFDSGFGGLTVARAITDVLPNESLIYFGDSQRCPYGPRSKNEVLDFATQITNFLLQFNIKALVVACNTATAFSLSELKNKFSIPILGVIEPGAIAAVKYSSNKKIAILATKGTIDSHSYKHAITKIDAKCKIAEIAAPEFVELVENELKANSNLLNGYLDVKTNSALFKEFACKYQILFDQINDFDADTIVLGCTHFPIIKNFISELVPNKTIVSSAKQLALDLDEELKKLNIKAGNCNKVSYEFFTTSQNTNQFCKLGSKILCKEISNVKYIDPKNL
ncbi:MAG: glutamate racemase [Coriobacteriales bacterium]|nr:glutamate racemase [Coriobacteriales bacterium]